MQIFDNHNARIAVMGFGYGSFPHFKKDVVERGFYTANLGDYAQTIAAKRLLIDIGVPPKDILCLDRDSLCNYTGDRTVLLMSGVLRPQTFPIPDNIIPIPIGIHAAPQTIRDNKDWFMKNGPIGARDRDTLDCLQQHSIDSFLSGCVTFTFDKIQKHTRENKVTIVYGEGSGELPGNIFNYIPKHLMDDITLIYHRLPAADIPLQGNQHELAMKYESYLIDQLGKDPGILLTPLHHAASPALAQGTRTIICRKSMDRRFSLLSEFVPVYTPDNFHEIDWNPELPDFSPLAWDFRHKLKTALNRLGIQI